MNFEWDESKSKTNIAKRDLDFADAWQIFDAPMVVRIDNQKDYGEERFVGIGFLKNLVVVIVFTEPNEQTIRVVSLRKALKYEREQFEKYITNQLGET
ncbi:MAG: BrnT family toxin [Acidobacteriota bacterium]|nr:BrnT family toxin [Acidobacteriota bacterium]